ncbi:MAG: nuclear transport factor 2 family protein [Rhizobacter sp.]|nr:nuclear transport factor 2 family protein [Rhizobacter sp.]
MTAPRCADPRVARIVALFEHFTPGDIERLGEYYAAEARFKDPFNEVQGLAAVQQVYRHMFSALDEPRFVVRDIIVQGDQCFLSWDFLFRFRRYRQGLQTVRGGSQLQLDAIGLIAVHRDYWDAAEELYEKLPVLGSLMRWLKRRAGT